MPRALCVPRASPGQVSVPRTSPWILDPLLSWPQAAARPGGSSHLCSQPGGHWPREARLSECCRLAGQGGREGLLPRGLVISPDLASWACFHRCFGNIWGRGQQPDNSCPSVSWDSIQAPVMPCLSLVSPSPGPSPTSAPQSLFCLAREMRMNSGPGGPGSEWAHQWVDRAVSGQGSEGVWQ